MIATCATQAGITVGLFGAYGLAQRLYGRRGYVPDGRGACQGLRPLKQEEVVTIDHDLIIWLTKDFTGIFAAPEEPETEGNKSQKPAPWLAAFSTCIYR